MMISVRRLAGHKLNLTRRVLRNVKRYRFPWPPGDVEREPSEEEVEEAAVDVDVVEDIVPSSKAMERSQIATTESESEI